MSAALGGALTVWGTVGFLSNRFWDEESSRFLFDGDAKVQAGLILLVGIVLLIYGISELRDH